MSPVFFLMLSVRPLALRESQYSPVRLSCHTIALYTGSPVAASHTRVVSLWLVIPMAAMSFPPMPMEVMASAMTAASEDQISLGSCSTHPGWGKCWVNSFWATERMFPPWSNTIALEELVPWSRARMNFSMAFYAVWKIALRYPKDSAMPMKGLSMSFSYSRLHMPL